jgi:hypothetical protein
MQANSHAVLSRKYKHASSSAETWYSILFLSLADKWQFETIGKVAFEAFVALPDVEAMDKVFVCEQYGFDRSVASKAYWALCNRNVPLTYRESKKLGWVACLLIAAIRDRSVVFAAVGG